MTSADRAACADLTREKLIANAGRYDFYQLVELLQSYQQKFAETKSEFVRFQATASIAFPASDVVSLARAGSDGWRLTGSFIGLHGSQSPLPGYYLDKLAWEEAQQSNRLTDFLDLFNHRLLSLLHRIWRKYRYYICFEDEGEDEFSQRMFALVGLGSRHVRNQLQINHSRMLAYTGLLASPGRSPDVICSLVSHCFDLTHVSLDSWQLRRVAISPVQQNRLGGVQHFQGTSPEGRSVLNSNFTLGSCVRDRSGKFTLSINKLTRSRFLDFLPNGKSYQPLATFMSFILRDQFAWDLRLGIAPRQIGGMTLGLEQNSLLGWTCFVGSPASEPEVTIRVRE